MEQKVPLKVQETIFNQILEKPENKVCADCPNKSPTWASLDFGVFVCLRCSGAHRRLSPVVTRVSSAKIDDWKMDHIEIMAAVGNKLANDYWESNLPSYYRRPDINTSLDDVYELVRTKYVKAAYAAKDRINPVKEFLEARKDGQMTAGSFYQSKMAQKTKAPEVTNTTTTTTTKRTEEKKPSTKTENLLDFDDDFGDFKSAPEKTTKLDIPKPNVEVKFVSSNGQTQKSTTDLWDTTFETKTTTTNTNLKKTTSADPFSFDQPTTQKSNSTPSDSNKLLDLYKTGNPTTQNGNKPNNSSNFTGGQSNYAYLDMMGGQQNRYGQQQQQQFGFQGGMNSNQYYGGAQNQSSGFGTQSSMNGGFGSSGYGANNGFNSFGSTGFNSGPSRPTVGIQQQQPFSFGQPTTTTTNAFSFNTATSTQNFNQPTSVNAGFSFL